MKETENKYEEEAREEGGEAAESEFRRKTWWLRYAFNFGLVCPLQENNYRHVFIVWPAEGKQEEAAGELEKDGKLKKKSHRLAPNT